jgi:hypothetical protein
VNKGRGRYRAFCVSDVREKTVFFPALVNTQGVDLLLMLVRANAFLVVQTVVPECRLRR